ncbi:hypothetical protein EYF80_063187 [Liparis tanakae]|uniref:Uncharacterized protein n=1 Tax=Liparis tanakae TaxID=230148 RepID=A0A4Z2ECU3_9TELE|nr:hypothetical protein EYF80_063187 [Liparis tanakae]
MKQRRTPVSGCAGERGHCARISEGWDQMPVNTKPEIWTRENTWKHGPLHAHAAGNPCSVHHVINPRVYYR